MRKLAPRSSLLLLLLCSALPASAQLFEGTTAKLSHQSNKVEGLDYTSRASFASDQFLSGAYQLPAVSKTSGDLDESPPVYVSQDSQTLSARRSTVAQIENVLDFSVLKEPSAYRNATRIKLQVSDAQASGIRAGLQQISAAYSQPGKNTDSADCNSVTLSVAHRVRMDPSMVLEIVESEISANRNCACEIIKIAIKASAADEALVGDITEAAITAAPESMRMISQCAIAAMPEALAQVQAVLAKLDPHRGESSHSAKSAKSGKEAIASAVAPPEIPSDPLNLPPPIFPPTPPPPYFPPPVVTNPNPIP